MAEPQGGGGGGRGGSAKSLNFPDFFYFDGTPYLPEGVVV